MWSHNHNCRREWKNWNTRFRNSWLKGCLFLQIFVKSLQFLSFWSTMSRDIFFNNISYETIKYLVDKGRKLNWHKTFRRRPGRLLNALCTFSLRSVSTGYGAGKFYKVSRNTICRSSHPKVFNKKDALKNFQNPQKNTWGTLN